ncbi:hypothetical protein M413DRAFT_20449 [Hebeloma cylindrosporum]|uniref:C2H2-type domain-containing protein n=1 Tax=Hebeloma cylindrosporum TaxID=76867 RepID=A0A0C2Y6H9_HEBCY|nr:hypothetical protein M413DRAFT_20449 [Hebeloma cylindrosporum h7]
MAATESPKLPDTASYASSPITRVQSAPQLSDVTQPSSSTHRPLTRSQTGTVFKRRRRDDSDHIDSAVPKKRAPAPRKRQKAPKPPTTREASLTASISSGPAPSSGNQITFLHSSDPVNGSAEPRLPRSRASLPTPIPNLTKKSRGRRVPTQVSTASDPDQRATRLYVCTVDGCGKCFHRGEHLKRHIRSIHTHEKPFKCTFSLCQKYFNRHDNLLQHLKVHKDPTPKPSSSAEPPTSKADDSPPRIFTASGTSHRRNDSYSSVEDPESPIMMTSSNAPRTIYNAFPITTTSTNSSYHSYPSAPPVTTYSIAPDSIRLITNMAVSSLRTELPQSPTDSRGAGGMLQAGPY